jgi:hypothetical protein
VAEAFGVVAGGDEELAGGLGADALLGEEPWRGGPGELGEVDVELADLGGERFPAAGEVPQRPLGRRGGVHGGGWAPVGAAGDALGGLQRAKLVPDRFWSGEHEILDLVADLGPGLDRARAGDAQHPDRFDDADACFGRGGRLTGQHRPSGGFGIGRVGLAASTTALPVGPVHLDDLDTGVAEEPGQTGAVGAGSLDPGSNDVTVAARPAQELPVAANRRFDRERVSHTAEEVHHDRDMELEVGVDAEDDVAGLTCHRGHGAPVLERAAGATPAGTADRTLTVQREAKAPIRSRPPDRSVRVRAGPGSTDQRQATKGQSHPESDHGPEHRTP